MAGKKILATANMRCAFGTDSVEILNATFRGSPALKLSGANYCKNVRYVFDLERLQKRIERDARFVNWVGN